MQGKGVNLPPPGYLERAQELCRRYGTLFCVDEVQTGFGRTGRMFAFQHWGLEPDLVPVAKSLSGGYVPIGALLMSRAVHEAVYDSMENAFSHGSTFAPNELAMAAGLATLVTVSSYTADEDFTGAALVVSSLGELPDEPATVLADPYRLVVRGEVHLDDVERLRTAAAAAPTP